MQKIGIFINCIIYIIIFFVNIFVLPVSGKVNVDLDNPKESKIKIKEEPDLLVPEPETPKQIKKREKEEAKAQKRSNKKVKPEKYIKSKKIKKRSYGSVKKEIKAPKTFEEYLEMAQDKKRGEYEVPKADNPKDDKLVPLPEPGVALKKYNSPPDLRQLMTRHELVTQGVLSPDNNLMAYSVVYSYPTSEQVASELFYIKIPEGTSPVTALSNFHTIEAEREPILKVGTEKLFQYEKRTFTIIDWSESGKQIAVKEKTGAQTQGPWKTQIWTYDFETEKGYELTALREAIRYYWKTKYDIDLIDYMWDIYPIGWDLYNKDRIIAYAYAFGKNYKGAKFLGTWSIDYKNQRSEIMSETTTNFEVSVNGYCLKFKRE